MKSQPEWKTRLGRWLRKWADRIDYDGAPRISSYSFTFENERGLVLRDDRQGCPILYPNREYERAHTEADTSHIQVDWVEMRSRWIGGP